MGDQTQLKDKEKQDQSQEVVENKADQAPDEPKSVDNQKVTKERLERMKKAFRPSWLIDQIDSPDSKKGK